MADNNTVFKSNEYSGSGKLTHKFVDNGDGTFSEQVATGAAVPGTGATNLGKAEDAVHASGDVGVEVLAVRRDTATAAAADGDYCTFSVDSLGQLRTTNPDLVNLGAGEYETVAASQTAQVLGGAGAIGDYLAGVLVIPATLSPGNVIILDNAISITIFTGGATSVADLKPFYIQLGMKSVSGAWKVTTGASISVVGIGNFT